MELTARIHFFSKKKQDTPLASETRKLFFLTKLGNALQCHLIIKQQQQKNDQLLIMRPNNEAARKQTQATA